MACKTNNRFKVHSNIKMYLDEDFKKHKAIHDSKPENDKYRWLDYYEVLGWYCGVSPSTITQMKNKNLLPSLVVALRLAKWLNVSVEDLLQAVEKESTVDAPKCVVEGCDRYATTRDLCLKHSTQFYNNKEHKEES